MGRLRTADTTNGFVFSENLIGNVGPFAVVPLVNSSYAVRPLAARRVAKANGAFGFWRVKR
jgi:hypothetical protein